VYITAGAGTHAISGAGGEIVVVAGEAQGSSPSATGGRLVLTAGTSQTGIGGSTTVTGGASGTGTGGALLLRGGDAVSGNGGDAMLDAGDSDTGAGFQGVVRIGSLSASYVQIGRPGIKAVQTDVFGDLVVHGNLVATSDVNFADRYVNSSHLTVNQDMMVQHELRVPMITGLDTEDALGTVTSTLTLDAGGGGTEQHLIIGPTVATSIVMGGNSNTDGAGSKAPIVIQQGYSPLNLDEDTRFRANPYGAVLLQSAQSQELVVQSVTTSAAISGNVIVQTGAALASGTITVQADKRTAMHLAVSQ